MRKKLRCYLGLHRYERRLTDDGQRYKECRDCGKFLDMPGPFIGPGLDA
jgi:hypothetical protein